jgi:uncharacterized protein YecE (DUF72 family)
VSHPISIGTCGWSYPEWKGNFYPGGVQTADFLTAYARRFPVVEVDSTFYRSPTPAMVEGWNAKTPDAFGLCLKVPQTITHEKLLLDCGVEVDQFAGAVRMLGHKLRCCVLQFPYFNRSKFSSLDAFLDRLRSFLATWPTDIPLAIEIRNAKWVGAPFADCLRAHRTTWVLADIVRMPSPLDVVQQTDAVTSSLAYVRLIGNRNEVERLTKTFDRVVVDRSEQILAAAEAIRRLAGRVPVVVFVNNHFAGYAPETIRELRVALGLPADDPEDDWFFGGPGK